MSSECALNSIQSTNREYALKESGVNQHYRNGVISVVAVRFRLLIGTFFTQTDRQTTGSKTLRAISGHD
jgi:hypothetical protein